MFSRRAALISSLRAEGLNVNESAIEQCIDAGILEQYLSAALQAAVHIMRGYHGKSISYLARFWGSGQNRAMTVLFARNTPPGLLENPNQLIRAVTELAPNLTRKGYSFHTIITKAVIGHHISMATGQPGADSLPEVIGLFEVNRDL